MSKLKKCPCGKTPKRLGIEADGRGGKWAYVMSYDCCGEWMVEFRTQYEDTGSAKCMEYAIRAWNNTPREE